MRKRIASRRLMTLALLLSAAAQSSPAQQSVKDGSLSAPAEANCEMPLIVNGAVNMPGRFELHRRVRLLELLTYAGGPNERAGRTVQIIHSLPAPACEKTTASDSDRPIPALEVYSLAELLRGDEDANPYVRAGDIITVLSVGHAYVLGHVFKPQAVVFDKPITLTQAIAMVGGVLRDAITDKVAVYRQTEYQPREVIYVNLKMIKKHRAQDLILQTNDIVEVRGKGSWTGGGPMIGAIPVAPSPENIPVRVIP